MQVILDKCKCEETQASKRIKKLGNAFSNGQQMSIQHAVHICLSIPLYHSTSSFHFINTYEKKIGHLFYYYKNLLNKLFSNSTNIHCKSLIEKYKTWNESLNHNSLA
jgi:hypothetical protein